MSEEVTGASGTKLWPVVTHCLGSGAEDVTSAETTVFLTADLSPLSLVIGFFFTLLLLLSFN